MAEHTRPRIWIVDDDPELGSMLQAHLAQDGHAARWLADGSQLLALRTLGVRSGVALLASVALAAPQVALAQQQKPVAPRLTPQQQEQLFPEQKALWLKHQRARISAIQTAERCVDAARTAEAFKGCLR